MANDVMIAELQAMWKTMKKVTYAAWQPRFELDSSGIYMHFCLPLRALLQSNK
jgi:hypothetical protein